MFTDPDDILSENIIRNCYNLAEKFKYEMIRFNIYFGNGYIILSELINQLKSTPIYQPELSTYLFYALGKIEQIDYNISSKFIKRTAFLIVLNYLEKYYLNVFMLMIEDTLMSFLLYRTVKSFYFLKKIGYYYIQNDGSISTKNDTITSNKYLNFIFIYLKIILDFTKNTLKEKNIFNYNVKKYLNIKNVNKLINFLKSNFSLLDNKNINYSNYIMNKWTKSNLIKDSFIKKNNYIIYFQIVTQFFYNDIFI